MDIAEDVLRGSRMDGAEDVLGAHGGGKKPSGPGGLSCSTETSNSSIFRRAQRSGVKNHALGISAEKQQGEMLRYSQHDRGGALGMTAKGRSRGRLAATDERGCAVSGLHSRPLASSGQALHRNDRRFEKASVVRPRLVECKHGALRVCQDCPAANFLHGRGSHKGPGAQFLGLGGGLVAIRDVKVRRPVGGRKREVRSPTLKGSY